jgi:polysaccharide pyruvyl transferase WcaK-like protein
MNVLLVGEIASPNLGDQAIFATLRHLLQSHGCRVTGFDLSRYERIGPTDGLRGCRPLSDKTSLSSHLKGRLLKVVSVLPDGMQKWVVFLTKKRADLLHRKAWQSYMGQFDLVVFGGGALLMDNNWSFPLALRNISRSVRAAHGRYVCIGCSTGRRFSKRGRGWLKEFLDHAEYISLRDSNSMEGLRRLGDYDAEVHVDSALLTSALMPDLAVPDPHVLGLNIMSPVRHPTLTPKVYGSYLDEMADFIELTATDETNHWKRIVVFTTGDERDHAAASALVERPQVRSAGIQVELVETPGGLDELCATIAGCGLVISSRMHAGILAKSYGRPLIPLGWDEKVRGFCDAIGIGDSFMDIQSFSAEALLARVSRIVGADMLQPDEVSACVSALERLPERLEQLAGQADEERVNGSDPTRVH